jgi:hypothetical protein
MPFKTEKLPAKPAESQGLTERIDDGAARTDDPSGSPAYFRGRTADTPAGLIFINCPNTGMAVTTGLKTEWVVFGSLPPVAVPLRCPACGQVHRWKPQDAWIGRVDRARRSSSQENVA